jgi:hypothetical protein
MSERVLIFGSRDWTDWKAIEREVRRLRPGTVVIHGDARGADKMAGHVARTEGFSVVPYPAKWTEFGKAAGPIRNQEMLDEGKPDRALCFHPDLDTQAPGSGSADMARRLEAAGIPYEVINR